MHGWTKRAAQRLMMIAAVLLAVTACGTEPEKPAATGAGSDTAGADDALGDAAIDGDTLADGTQSDGSAATDADPTDGGAGDAAGVDAQEDAWIATDSNVIDAGPDTFGQKVCSSGDVKCDGAKLATCGALEDGWILSNCFPGQTCSAGKCVPVKNNLIVVFDSSGSMTAGVKLGCWCGSGCSEDKTVCPTFLCKGTSPTGCTQKPCPLIQPPACDPSLGCSRMDISKMVFSAALDKIDASTTRMAMFRFPQALKQGTSNVTSCTSGFYTGKSTLSGEQSPGPKDQQSATPSSAWFWPSINETLCVPFPADGNYPSKAKMKKWMDGTEAMAIATASCANPSSICKPVLGCDGACCSNKCYHHTDPELRPTGGTPIGKTLFYVGEYLRNAVIIDGKKCTSDADCNNVNYACKQGVCKDPARSCRSTVVVLFTDGGQSNSATNYFAPWVQAKRMSTGLKCQGDQDCVGDSKCLPLGGKPTDLHCQYDFAASGGIDTFCSTTGAACLPTETDQTQKLYCPGQCVRHPQYLLTGQSAGSTGTVTAANNVLRSPDGKPFGVKVHVVDISAQAVLTNSMSLALAGNGKLLGADAADPDKFLESLNSVFDIKNIKVCGESF